MDDNLVTMNHRLTSKGISAIPEIFTSPYYEDQHGYAYEYRPVVLVSFAIEHSLFGENPQISHFINVLLYALLGLLLFKVLMMLLPSANLLFHTTVLLLFLAHPIHTEVVANIKNRDEILSLIGGLLTFYFAIKIIDKNSFIYIPGIIVSFVFGLLAKMSILPFALLVPLGIILFKKPRISHLMAIAVPLIVITLIIVPLSFPIYRVYFGVALSGFIFLIFIHYNEASKAYLVNKFKQVYIWLSTTFRPKSNKVNDLVFIDEKTDSSIFFKEFLSSRVALIFLAIISLSAFLPALTENNIYLAETSIILTSLFIFFGSNAVRQVGFLLLLLTLGILSYWFKVHFALEIAGYIYFINFLFSERNKKSWYNILILGLYTVFAFLTDVNEDFVFAFIGLLLVYLVFNKKIKSWIFYSYASFLFVFAIGLIVTFFLGDNPFKELITQTLLPIILTVVYVVKKPLKIRQGIVLIVALLFVVDMHFFVMKSDYINKIPPKTQNENVEDNLPVDDEREFQILSPQTFFSANRPIDFVEMPLRYDSPWTETAGTSFYVLAEYIKLMFVPHPMGFYYGYAHIVPVGLTNIQAIISIVLHLFLLIVALLFLFKFRNLILAYGIIFYLASISVFSNILYPVVGMMGDRFTFVASVGFCMAVAFLIMKVSKLMVFDGTAQKLKPTFSIIMVVLLTAYSFKTIARNNLWKDPLTLMKHDIKYLENSAQANNLLARYSMQAFTKSSSNKDKQKYLNQGIKHFAKACEIYPEFFNARYDLGRALTVSGRYNEAIQAFTKVLEFDSTFTDAMVAIASIYEENNMPQNAIPYYRQTIRYSAYALPFYASLSYAYFRLGEYDKAIETNVEALKRYPGSFDPYFNLGKTYMEMGDIPKAIENFENAFKIKREPQIAGMLADLYRRQGNIKMSNYYQSLIAL